MTGKPELLSGPTTPHTQASPGPTPHSREGTPYEGLLQPVQGKYWCRRKTVMSFTNLQVINTWNQHSLEREALFVPCYSLVLIFSRLQIIVFGVKGNGVKGSFTQSFFEQQIGRAHV